MFKFGNKSIRELQGVYNPLVSLCLYTIKVSPVDFSVHDGIRTPQEQAALVAAGASKTLASYHLPNMLRPHGKMILDMGQAVDLVPYINGKLRWEWDPIYTVIETACGFLPQLPHDHKIRWGGVWDRTLDQLDPKNLHKEIEAYTHRMKLLGKRAFCDGPHLQIEVY